VNAPSTAAILTIGSELVAGSRVDTNTAVIARALGAAGYAVIEAVSIGDDESIAAAAIARLCAQHRLVVCTGGLGPTHDDVTRKAAAHALGLGLERDQRLVELLRPIAARHTDPRAAEQVFTQSEVLAGAEVIDATTGTAPGQIVPTALGVLALLPGPPSEMEPMLARVVGTHAVGERATADLGVTGMSESDAQVLTQGALAAFPDMEFTVLARPGDVRVLLTEPLGDRARLAEAVDRVAGALGDNCYSTTGSSLAQVVVEMATARRVSVAAAESCTGGMVTAELTEVPGSSEALLGGVVCYSNQVKMDLLDVPAGLLAQYGAVSEECARAMAQGVGERLGAQIAVAVTGIAGPAGGSAEKPVGTVWFAVDTAQGTSAHVRHFKGGGRHSIRLRATATALDLVRRSLLGTSTD
jgi:nicotinamide-nucleotide amidase